MALPYRWQYRVDRWKQAFGNMFGGGEKRPKLCPSCGALVGINATRCHECGANLRFGLAAWSKGLAEFFGGHAPVTVAILIANIVLFAAEIMGTMQAGQFSGLSILWRTNGELLYRLGASFPPSIYEGHQYYRLITAMFLHSGLVHIGFNMMILLDLGPIVEEAYGSARYLFFYLTMGLVSFVVSSLVGHFSVGASGAIIGLIGILIAYAGKRGGAQMKEMRSRWIAWVVTLFALSWYLGGLQTDNWAHAGGLAAGFVIGKISMDRAPMNGPEKTRAYALGWLAGLAILASFVFMVLHYRDPLPM